MRLISTNDNTIIDIKVTRYAGKTEIVEVYTEDITDTKDIINYIDGRTSFKIEDIDNVVFSIKEFIKVNDVAYVLKLNPMTI